MKQPNKRKIKKAVLSGAKKMLYGFARPEDATPEALKKPRRKWSVSASIPIGTGAKKKKQIKKIKKWKSNGNK